MGGFSYTSRVGFIFIWGVSLTHPLFALILCGDFLLHVPCWVFCLSFFLIWGLSLPHPMLASFLCGEFLLHIPCWLHFYRGVSLTHPMPISFLSWEFILHIPGSFSYTSLVCFNFLRGFSLTRPMLAFLSFFFFFLSFLCGEFLLYIPCWLHFYRGLSLTHPMPISFLSREFILHIPWWLYYYFFFCLGSFPCWLHFYLGGFSYTSPAGVIFILGVSLTHPFLALLFCGEFLLHVPCWLLFFLIWGVSLTHPVLA